jgi:hypothetical protein
LFLIAYLFLLALISWGYLTRPACAESVPAIVMSSPGRLGLPQPVIERVGQFSAHFRAADLDGCLEQLAGRPIEAGEEACE